MLRLLGTVRHVLAHALYLNVGRTAVFIQGQRPYVAFLCSGCGRLQDVRPFGPQEARALVQSEMSNGR